MTHTRALDLDPMDLLVLAERLGIPADEALRQVRHLVEETDPPPLPATGPGREATQLP